MTDEREWVEWRETGPVLMVRKAYGINQHRYTREHSFTIAHLVNLRDMAQRESEIWARRIAVLDDAVTAADGNGLR